MRVLVGTLAGLVTITTGAATAYSQAALQVEPASQGNSAFSIPFAIKNPSIFFNAYDVTLTCNILDLRSENLIVIDSRIDYMPLPMPILPGSQAIQKCNLIDEVFEMTALIKIQGTYKTLFFTRSIKQRRFRWLRDAVPPRWVEDGGT